MPSMFRVEEVDDLYSESVKSVGCTKCRDVESRIESLTSEQA